MTTTDGSRFIVVIVLLAFNTVKSILYKNRRSFNTYNMGKV